ncbi:MAG: flagellar basal body rod C-terminal domain-containing protein [Hyphomicrobiaceae bacterium]|nr:flagellar basal body rod C-terminal domain-containing protein [Hyphomicrobiaceae bacterium]
MLQAIAIAGSGMQAASERLAAAASSIANVSSAGPAPVAGPVSPDAEVSGTVAAGAVDLVSEMTNLMLARQDVLANAAVLRISDEMLQRLYDLVDDRG